MFHFRNYLTALLLFLSSWGHAQTWTYQIPWSSPLDSNIVFSAHELANGDYIIAGQQSDLQSGPQAFLAKLDPLGNTIWDRTFNYGQLGEVLETNGGKMIGCTFTPHYPSSWFWPTHSIFGLDANGLVAWDYDFDPSLLTNPDTIPIQMVATPDHGAMVGGYIQQPSGSTSRFLMKFDSTGTVQFMQNYPNAVNQFSRSLLQLDNHDFLLASITGQNELLVMRTDSLGTVLWEKSYQHNAQSAHLLAKQSPNGNILISLNSPWNNPNHAFVIGLNSVGDSLWLDDLSPIPNKYQMGSIEATPDNGMLIVGNRIDTLQSNMVWIAKYDQNRNLQWENFITTGYSFRNAIFANSTSDNGFVLGGWYHPTWNNVLPSTMGTAFKIDSTGQISYNTICGNAFFDMDQNCTQSPTEPDLSNIVVFANPGAFYAITDSLGNFCLQVGTGDVDLTFAAPYGIPWSLNCAPFDTITVNFPSTGDTANVELPLGGLPSCPTLDVHVTTWGMRPCFSSTHYVNYHNYGIVSAQNATITIELDSLLAMTSASIPYVQTAPNTYEFSIGTVDSLDHGSFTFNTFTSCNAVIGQTQCVKAFAYPDTLCGNIDPNWSEASLTVTAECAPTDTVLFTISNEGIGNMVATSGLWILEDDILRQTDSIFLQAGQDTIFGAPGNGSTWACIVDQVPFHPGNSLPRAVIEGCGLNLFGGFSTGHIRTLQTNDLDPWVDINCTVLTNSYDPNDKTGFPVGVGSDHRILDSDHLEYRIRFQNTGTDTAYRVVVRDVLPPELDLSTLVLGSSSHNYTFQILPGNIMEWTFDNIYLPDSNVNEPASHGVLTFQVQQNPNNQPGDRIDNAANIYFDFNAPILTDSAWHTLANDLIGVVITDVEEGVEEEMQMTVYPNPFTEYVNFRFEGKVSSKISFEVFDLQGQLLRKQMHSRVNEFRMERGNLPAGVYPYRIQIDGRVQTGKIIIR